MGEAVNRRTNLPLMSREPDRTWRWRLIARLIAWLTFRLEVADRLALIRRLRARGGKHWRRCD